MSEQEAQTPQDPEIPMPKDRPTPLTGRYNIGCFLIIGFGIVMAVYIAPDKDREHEVSGIILESLRWTLASFAATLVVYLVVRWTSSLFGTSHIKNLATLLRSKDERGTNIWWQIAVDKALRRSLRGKLKIFFGVVVCWAIFGGLGYQFRESLPEGLDVLYYALLFFILPTLYFTLRTYRAMARKKQLVADTITLLGDGRTRLEGWEGTFMERLSLRLDASYIRQYNTENDPILFEREVDGHKVAIGIIREFRASMLAAVIPLECVFPSYLTVHAEGVIERALSKSGRDDLNFESKEFSDKFWINSGSDKFAYALLHPRMMEFFLANPRLKFDLFTGCLLVCGEGMNSISLEDGNYLEASALKILELLPEHVMADAHAAWRAAMKA